MNSAIELDGVCYQGDLWLDGQYLGDTEGYFIRHAFDVSELIRGRADHELALEKVMGEVRATFPKDRRRWSVIFPPVRSRRGADDDPEVAYWMEMRQKVNPGITGPGPRPARGR